MKTSNWKVWLLCAALLQALAAAPCAAHSGSVSWKKWTFDWRVANSAGIALRSLRYNGILVMHEGSLPVIRVKYDGCTPPCGPYRDMITWDKLVEISNCGGVKVCTREFSALGKQWLEIGVYARIGKYHLYQGWYLSEDGVINPFLFSKGLHHDFNHIHHAYWRFDFDLNGLASDRIFESNDGQAMTEYTVERNALKETATNRAWYVVDNDKTFGNAVWISPRMPNDGASNSFSTKDAAGRLYHDSEHEPWPFPVFDHLGYDNSESIQKTDVVFWYVSHLFHDHADSGSQWHVTGPILSLWNYPP
ncbi:MAG: hypothetical protein ABUT39_21730 [Acidobacteriota bacterium]